MTSLERMLAAVHGEPFDMYPFINPYPSWSMMPHWPDMLALTFLHLSHGTDSERLRCYGAFHDLLGLDWIPIPEGPTGQDKRYRIETEEDVPVLVDMIEDARILYDEFPIDEPVSEPKFTSAHQVKSLPPPLTAEEMLKGESFDITRRLIKEYGDTVFLMAGHMAPMPPATTRSGSTSPMRLSHLTTSSSMLSWNGTLNTSSSGQKPWHV